MYKPYKRKATVPIGTLIPFPSWTHLSQNTYFSSCGDESVLRLIVVIIAQLWIY